MDLPRVWHWVVALLIIAIVVGTLVGILMGGDPCAGGGCGSAPGTP